MTYSDVEVPPVSPKPKGEPVHGKGKASTQDGYMNVVRTKPEVCVIKLILNKFALNYRCIIFVIITLRNVACVYF